MKLLTLLGSLLLLLFLHLAFSAISFDSELNGRHRNKLAQRIRFHVGEAHGEPIILRLEDFFLRSRAIRNARERRDDRACRADELPRLIPSSSDYRDIFDEICDNDYDAIQPRPGHIPQTNGCGTDWLNAPDFDFEQCCNQHDCCYSTCGVPRDYCDDQFDDCLERVCDREDSVFCSGTRWIYSTAVRIWEGFTEAIIPSASDFRDSQKDACQCVSLGRRRSVVKRLQASSNDSRLVAQVKQPAVIRKRALQKAESNTTEAAEPPSSWTCPFEFYGTHDGCDCNCGAPDPDCEDEELNGKSNPTFFCYAGSNGRCNSTGLCEYGQVPAEWTCPKKFYGSFDGCDCNCGAPDPDCAVFEGQC